MGMNGVVIVGLATGRSRGGRGAAGQTTAPPRLPADPPPARWEPVPAPMRWPGWLEHELRAVPGGIGQQHTTACNPLALRAGPGADARIERAAVEVRIAFLI